MNVEIKITSSVTLPDGTKLVLGTEHTAHIGDNPTYAKENVSAAQHLAMQEHTQSMEGLPERSFEPRRGIFVADYHMNAYGDRREGSQ